MTGIHSTRPTLLVLAAGLGSRFGGLKQLEGVGPGGSPLLDYAVFDAARAGFTEAIFVIRPEMEAAFSPFVAGRYGGRIAVRSIHQRMDTLPVGAAPAQGRTKPWGTAHAVLAAAGAIDGPFAVVNADDFYGLGAYQEVRQFLCGEGPGAPPDWGVVGYQLARTISEAGGVNRALCRTDADGWLQSIEEVRDLEPAGGGYAGRGASGPLRLTGDELVSMNMWAFTPGIFETLARGFSAFLERPDRDGAEYLLPDAAQQALRAGTTRIRVLDPGSAWFGMTHPGDRERVARELTRLVREGCYPEPLW